MSAALIEAAARAAAAAPPPDPAVLRHHLDVLAPLVAALARPVKARDPR